jgi:hypothetical protein
MTHARNRFVLGWFSILSTYVSCLIAAEIPEVKSANHEGSKSLAQHSQSDEVKAFRKTAVPVSFPSNGLTLHGWIYRPQGPGPFPAVLWNHGSERSSHSTGKAGRPKKRVPPWI